MIEKRRFGLMGQINILFTVVTLVTSVLFVIIFKQTFASVTKKQAERDFIYFSQELAREGLNSTVFNEYYSYAIYINEDGEYTLFHHYFKNYVGLDEVNNFVSNYSHIISVDQQSKKIITYEKLNYYFSNVIRNDKDVLIVTITDNTFEAKLREPINYIVFIGFLAIIILGNAIILLWTSIIVERIKKLKLEISFLTKNSYKAPIIVEGNDEITDLSREVNKMREEIAENEQTKKEMLQNLSHDIKTPIAVIKSYAEAIKDGVTTVDDLDVILLQTDVLSDKVKKLLEWNRLEYIEEKEEVYPVNLNKIITEIANNFKFKSNLNFELDLDNSYLEGLDEYFYTMISNIVENAVRYAKSIIKITLKNKKITVYNDGDPIDEKFLNNDFRPYQKGHKGNFGLGLSIVSKTAEKFHLKVRVKNIDNGVLFIIEPI